MFELDARIIDDPVSHTPLIVPIGRTHAAGIDDAEQP